MALAITETMEDSWNISYWRLRHCLVWGNARPVPTVLQIFFHFTQGGKHMERASGLLEDILKNLGKSPEVKDIASLGVVGFGS